MLSFNSTWVTLITNLESGPQFAEICYALFTSPLYYKIKKTQLNSQQFIGSFAAIDDIAFKKEIVGTKINKTQQCFKKLKMLVFIKCNSFVCTPLSGLDSNTPKR